MLTLPRQMLLSQRLATAALADPAAELRAAMERLATEDWRDRSVAVALGSRGIDRIGLVARTVVSWFLQRGARPFVLPAMGSHGGATPEGQTTLLASYGITEEALGVPIRAGMETEAVGRTASGIPVRLSAVARAADTVILVNRVKPHTDFESEALGSGLLKMAAIGLGKIEGAAACHLGAFRVGYEKALREVSAVVIADLSRVYGIGLVEDGTHRLGRVAVLRGSEIEAEERNLLAQARAWMPALPFADVDVLVVDTIGKNISGAGMDPNIIGRGVQGASMQGCRTRIRAIYARSLTPESHGNAVGIGLADVASAQLVGAMDRAITYTNALSAMALAPVRIPFHFDTDEACLTAAFRLAGAAAETARVLRIRDTLALDRLVASEAYVSELDGRDDLEVLVPPVPWTLDATGQFDPDTDLLRVSTGEL